MRFLAFVLAIVSPVNPELVSPVVPDKTDTSVQSLSTIITSGAGASDLVIEFGEFVTFLS